MEVTETGVNVKGEKKRGRDTSASLQIDEIEMGVYTRQADMTKKRGRSKSEKGRASTSPRQNTFDISMSETAVRWEEGRKERR